MRQTREIPVKFNQRFLVAVGSNQPSMTANTQDLVLSAIAALDSEAVSVDAISALYSSPAFPAGSGPDFVNGALALYTSYTPKELLAYLHGVEARFGRKRKDRWEPRILDLDLIAVGEIVAPDRNTVQRWIDLPLEMQMTQAPQDLILPHPRLQDRAFVLKPLMDIIPKWRHPVLGATVEEMFLALPEADKESLKRLVNPKK